MSAPQTDSPLAERVLACMMEAVIHADRQGLIALWNPAAETMFGFSAAEAIGQSLDIIIPEPQRAGHWAGFDVTMATGITKYGDGQLLKAPALTKDRGRISVEFTIVIIPGENNLPSGIVAVARDASEGFEERRAMRKRIAELEAGR